MKFQFLLEEMKVAKKKTSRPYMAKLLVILLVTVIVWDIRSAGSFYGKLPLFLQDNFIHFCIYLCSSRSHVPININVMPDIYITYTSLYATQIFSNIHKIYRHVHLLYQKIQYIIAILNNRILNRIIYKP